MIQPKYLIAVIICIWLILCSWQDIRKKKIHVILIGIGFLTILTCSFLAGEITIWSRLAGLGLGILLLLLNPITRGQIGIGDGLIVSIMGLGVGFNATSFILAYGLFGSAVFSIGLILFRKVNRKATIPFIPFILLGYLGVLFI
jgi:leader peptidase (prepilin peptidase) / N-methyltransferase